MNQHNWNPGKLLEVSGSFWQTSALHAGVMLELFSNIGDGSIECGELAGKLEADERGLSMLLNALAAMGLIVKAGEKYANSDASRAFLCLDSPEYVGYMIKHHRRLIESWVLLDQAVKSGKPVGPRSSFSEDQARENFIMGMFNIASRMAPEVAQKVDLSGRARLLDLGGGPGTYAIHFCLKNEGLKAAVFDLPTTRPFATGTIERFDMADRIVFIGGNYIDDEITGSFDVVWMSHILHSEGPDNCRIMIEKAVAALEPGGMIIVHDFILDNTMDGPLYPALFALNMLLATENGQSYSEQQIMQMLADAGVTDTRRLDYRGPTESGIITGIVP
jgi:SAM-dependent methyltransferase